MMKKNGAFGAVIRKLGRAIPEVLRGAAGTVFPSTCAVCGRTLCAGEKCICTHCLTDLPRTSLHLGGECRVSEAYARTVPFVHVWPWFVYKKDSPYSVLVRGAKYGDRPQMARHLGALYASEILRTLPGAFDGIDVLLPVPMYVSKRLSRGFNQAEAIAEGIGRVTGIPTGDNLTSVRNHHTQTRRSFEERVRNIAGCYALVRAHELEGLHVAIVDDVITSGATAGECGRILAASVPGVSVSVISLAIAGEK